MALTVDGRKHGDMHPIQTATEQAKEVVDGVETYEITHGDYYSKRIWLKLVPAAMAMTRVRDETEEPTKTQRSVLLGDIQRRVCRDVSHDCTHRANSPCKVRSRIAEVYETAFSSFGD